MKNIKYALRGITMEQFATIFEPSSDKISLNVSIPIKTNYEGHSLAVGASVQFVENEKPFLVAGMQSALFVAQSMPKRRILHSANSIFPSLK